MSRELSKSEIEELLATKKMDKGLRKEFEKALDDGSVRTVKILCAGKPCSTCKNHKACNGEIKRESTKTRARIGMKIMRELQEVVPGGYHHPFASPVVVAERLNKARSYLEYVDKYLDVLQRIAQQEARIEQAQ